MITYFTKFLYFYYKNAYLINKLIFTQSRNEELYLFLGLEDNFQNRLNFQILHLSLIMISLDSNKNNKFFKIKLSNKIFKIFLYQIDLFLREKGYGDKIIEKKNFEISNLAIIQFNNYHSIMISDDQKLFNKIIKNNFNISSKMTNISSLKEYIDIQYQKLSNVDFFDKINQDTFWNKVI